MDTFRPLYQRFDDAMLFAAKAHRYDSRKGSTIPYVAHVLGVCATVLEHGGDEDEAIAALLHDVAEDHGGKRALDKIDRRFGRRVAGIVEACSDSLVDTTGGAEKEGWRKRKRRYVEHLEACDDPSVLLVSASDKLYNARSILSDHRVIGDRVYDRFKADRKRTLWYYKKLARIFIEKDPSNSLFRELYRTVAELDRRGPFPG